jgi:hypothetical protein
MRVDTLLRKEKEGSLFKNTKLASVTYGAFLDELQKIAEGSPVGKLVNADRDQFPTDEMTTPKRHNRLSDQTVVDGSAPPPEDFSSATQDSTGGGLKG